MNASSAPPAGPPTSGSGSPTPPGAHTTATTTSGATTASGAAADTRLAARTLGVKELVFLIIAASAPLTVLAGGATTSFAVTGDLGVPVGYLVLGAVLIFFAIGYGRMSSFVRNAGAFYAYISTGIGTRLGIGASFLAMAAYNAMQIGLYGIFGFVTASFINDKLGTSLPWWACALAALIIVAVLGVRKVDLSASVLAVIVSLEFLVVIIVSAISVAVAPEGLSAEPFLPEHWLTGSLGTLLAFGIAAFMGFESGAIYSEETKDPQRSVSKATFIAVAIIGAFYALSAWAFAMGVGPSQIIAGSQELGPDLMFAFLGEHVPVVFTDIAFILFVTSIFAALMAFHNAAARYFFSLGRARVLPAWLGHTGARTQAPVAGSLTQSGLAVVFIIVFALAGMGSELGPLFPVLTMFTWLTNTAAFGMVLLLCLTSLAVIGYFRTRTGAHPAFVRLWAPIIATVGLGIIFVLIMLNFDAMIDAEGSPLTWILPGAMVGTGLIGLAWGQYLKSRRPDIYDALAEAHIG
ncbi:APC family permease [Brevibacterium luteolum]|uniref:APC family permease n=1 Tax=Brevibacterium luteolum TaxID=199591 RepID=A0A6G8KZR6_9MICO|nr:APC family permease [Brevibacterium luteolum]QIN30113.1 APC family permease [Brevibacterium luteolum]